MLKIPHQQLSPQALRGLLEEFITREGTDYGEFEVSLEEKLASLMQQLNTAQVFVVFDPATERSHVVTAEQWREAGLE